MVPKKKDLVLVVEDNEDMRWLIGHYLTARDMLMLDVPDGVQAKAVLGVVSPDIIVSDVCMPNMSGLELLAWVRGRGSEVPFVLLSQTEQKADLMKAIRLGATDFIEKPVRPDELVATLGRILGARRALAELPRARALDCADLMASLAREIEEPISCVLKRAARVRDLLAANELSAAEGMIANIESGARRISGIVDNLSRLSARNAALQREQVRLGDLLDKALELCGERAQAAGIEVVASESIRGQCVEYAGSQLLQIFVCLIHNACDAVEHSPEKWLRLEAGSAEPGLLNLAFRHGAPAPDAAHVSRLFEPSAESGPGLGLCRRVLASLGGDLRVDLADRHACFLLSIPQASVEAG